ncbi:deoxynucleoside triphosphate triphosphohydrolase SAMHD1-like [Xenia sp. Carnegie-2017]|uniref:deoxynucleoside triphosphate triphosphohydrolase SAMHD1-like n=1 Tax=Xenia sp. Carnegie-2017 TaxID=2897299 RepID=UPI001F0355DE|nr:deoxynucleoside triphosphate triphosphohydrolase SAMHD1-like [Xenia sp. Carnegie-2017]
MLEKMQTPDSQSRNIYTHRPRYESPIAQTDESPRFQLFNDPIHGFVEFHPLLVNIIHTAQFQRLKDIKQLGICYWVFPGASHNRFEHCLGTSYLCGKLIDTLQELHRGEIEITDKECLCIKVAGLCHDLGHGPFSHFFDGVYLPQVKPYLKWEHESASCDLLDHMLHSNPDLSDCFMKYSLYEEDINFIKELIMGKDPDKEDVTRICDLTRKPKWFLYEIVSNKRNGIDCDKFDYFSRDCANVGVKSNFDHRRYFQNVRIMSIDDQLQICVRDKEVFNLYELFHTRWSLHHRVYQHKTHAPIEDLLARAFYKVDKIMKISESVNDMKRYTVLTDSILYDILRNDSEEPGFREAQELIRCIQERKIYKFCGQTQPPSGSECPSKHEIALELIKISDEELRMEGIFVSIVDFNFGMKDKDPIDAVTFYNKSHKPVRVGKEHVSQMLPQNFHERFVRVYAKQPENAQLLQRCFKAWCSRRKYPVPLGLEGTSNGYFSPAFKSNPSSRDGSALLPPRSLKSMFDKCESIYS